MFRSGHLFNFFSRNLFFQEHLNVFVMIALINAIYMISVTFLKDESRLNVLMLLRERLKRYTWRLFLIRVNLVVSRQRFKRAIQTLSQENYSFLKPFKCSLKKRMLLQYMI